MTELKLQVGRFYANRIGQIINIYRYEPKLAYPYRGRCVTEDETAGDEGYREDGSWGLDETETSYDLVRECKCSYEEKRERLIEELAYTLVRQFLPSTFFNTDDDEVQALDRMRAYVERDLMYYVDKYKEIQ